MIYGEMRQIQKKLENDHVLHDGMCQVPQNGPIFIQHGVTHQINQLVNHLHQRILLKIYSYHLLVTAITVLLVSSVAVSSGTIGLLLRTVAITPTACTLVRPMSVLRAAATVPTGARCVVLRIHMWLLLNPLT